MSEIKVGYCVAYDWELLRHSLPTIYSCADAIWISIDKNRRSWSGSSYECDEDSLHGLILSIDTENKIKIYQDDFFINDKTSSQNEIRQRKMLAQVMGEGGWHIQLDCDEYFLDFEGFTKHLKSLEKNNKLFNVCCPLMTLFKQVENGFVYVWPETPNNIEYIQIANQSPQYEYGRRNGQFNIYTNSLIVHQSWARSHSEIEEKISNWGHRSDFDAEVFLSKWAQLNKANYIQLKNFHPISPSVWSSLKFHEAENIEILLKAFRTEDFPKLSNWQLAFRNSRLLSYVRYFMKLIIR